MNVKELLFYELEEASNYEFNEIIIVERFRFPILIKCNRITVEKTRIHTTINCIALTKNKKETLVATLNYRNTTIAKIMLIKQNV